MTYLEQWLRPETPELYDSVIYNAESYDGFIWSLQEPFLREVTLGLRRDGGSLRYLDFACGTGRILTALEDLVDQALGLDLAPPMADRARSKSNTEIRVADVCDPGQRPNEVFDLITAFRFFLNVDDDTRTRVMSALAAMLQPETGVLIFNVHGCKTSAAALVKWRPDRSRSNQLMSIGQARRLVENAGLRIVDQVGYGFLPRMLYGGRFGRLVRKLDRRLSGRRLSRVSHDVVFVCAK